MFQSSKKCDIKEKMASKYKRGIGYRYLIETKYYLDRPLKDDLGEIPFVPLYKTYLEAPKLSLPREDLPLEDFARVISKRRSRRYYKKEYLSLKEISCLLWASQGITSEEGLRAAPSAGALYPIETYLFIFRVEGVPSGIYHFNVRDFLLERLAEGDFSQGLTAAALGQGTIRRAAVAFVWTAVILRTMAKYRDRAIRYIFLDAGHICQNLLLAATALNLGACPIGAFFDDEINKLLKVDGEQETTIYLATVGKL